MKIEQLYQCISAAGEMEQRLRNLLDQTHWFTKNSVFDPRSGDALPQALTNFLHKKQFQTLWGKTNNGTWHVVEQADDVHDRLWRITEHARDSILRLLRTLNESPSREQALMPIRKVRELDANSFIKLSNRPGRNIREKLVGKPYLQAVRHYLSIDLPENRLFKAFLQRLSNLLEIKSQCLDLPKDELVQISRLWLNSDEAKSISRWENTPPNNTLLSHRDYRRIWDAWCWLQSLDEDIDKDLSSMDKRQKIMEFWRAMRTLKTAKNIIFAEIPLQFDYEEFTIEPWQNSALQFKTDKSYMIEVGAKIPDIKVEGERPEVQDILVDSPACVDIISITPEFAVKDFAGVLDANLIWQNWADSDNFVDIPLFNAEAIWQHQDSTTITSSDLFFPKRISRDYLERAAKAFVEKLSLYFRNDALIWLIPDFANDFDLEILRRNINACFSAAEPLPRSIAAVIQQINYDKIPRDGYVVIVVDLLCEKKSITKVIARYSDELKNKLPLTHGYRWERHPTVILSEREEQSISLTLDVFTQEGLWKSQEKKSAGKADINHILHENNIDGYDTYIVIDKTPITGGIKLFYLQKDAENVPLWEDYLPNLSMRVRINGISSEFPLVKNMTISPLRRKRVSINIPETYKLPAKQKYYEFPLTKGNGQEEFHYLARLSSTAFPLDEDALCKLTMTYEYGADKPYVLTFESLNSSAFKYVVAEWALQEDKEIDPLTLPIPELPPARNWNDLQAMQGKDGEIYNILEDFLNRIYFTKINQTYNEACAFSASNVESQKVELTYCWWNTLYEDKYYFWAQDDSGKMVYCSSERIIDDNFSPKNLSKGETFYANISSYPPRKTLIISKVSWDRNGDLYCLAITEDEKPVFCHSNNFIEKIPEGKLAVGKMLYGLVKADKNNPERFIGSMLTMRYGNDYAHAFQISKNKLSVSEQEQIKEIVEKTKLQKFSEWYKQLANVRNMILGLRYDFLTIWNAGRTLDKNSDVPAAIRDRILEEIDAAYQTYRFLALPKIRRFIDELSMNQLSQNDSRVHVDVIRARILDFLSALNGNTPPEIPVVLAKFLEDSGQFMYNNEDSGQFMYNNRAIAFAIGTLQLPWQKELFDHFLSFKPAKRKLRSIKLEDWAIILWRSLDIVDILPYEEIHEIIDDLSYILHSELDLLKKTPDDEFIPQRIGRHLDLLLALFRTRKSPNEQVRTLLLPFNKYSRDFLDLLEQIVKLNIEITSHSVMLKLDKPASLNHLSDLIFALQLYLSGDDGANSIQIISNDDND